MMGGTYSRSAVMGDAAQQKQTKQCRGDAVRPLVRILPDVLRRHPHAHTLPLSQVISGARLPCKSVDWVKKGLRLLLLALLGGASNWA